MSTEPPGINTTSLAIVIKAGRRPWALERLINSLYEHCEDFDSFRTLVVDDRTSPKDIEILVSKFPGLDWTHSSKWNSERGNHVSLPYVEAWKSAIAALDEDHVLILEDDQWLTETLQLGQVLRSISNYNAISLSLGIGSDGLYNCELVETKFEKILSFTPRIKALQRPVKPFQRSLFERLISSPIWFWRKISAVLTVGGYSRASESWKTLAMVNPMCGAIYNREHWLSAWRGNHRSILENKQIDRVWKALETREKIYGSLLTTSTPFFRTSYVTSMSLRLGHRIDWEKINATLAQAWREGNLRSPVNKEDWDSEYLARIIGSKLSVDDANEYRRWVVSFKKLHT